MAMTEKRPRVSKNKKKNWRKHCDITDVEEHLDTVRFEERTGGRVSEKADGALFFVQTKTDLKAKRKAKKSLQLRCYQHLEPSQWPEPCIKPNQSENFRKKQRLLVQNKKTKRIKVAPCNSEPKKEQDLSKAKEVCVYDLWNEKDTEVIENDYERDILDFYKSQTRIKKINVPAFRYLKSSALKAVELPHAGASYNPTYDDYQKLCSEAHSIELRKKKEEDHLNRVLTRMFPTKSRAPTQLTWLQEMSEGLPYEGETVKEDEMLEEAAALPLADTLPAPTVRADRKLRSKKRREQLQKSQAKQLENLKKFRKQQNDVYRLKSIKSQINASEKLTEERVLNRKRQKEEKAFKPATLSSYKYEAPDLEVCTVEEISGSLRDLKPQGSLAEDRIKSFERRNIIESRIRQLRKNKYKKKVFTKKGHKIEDI